MTQPTIIIYATDWCPDCHRVRRYFQAHQIPFQWINIDRDPEAEAFVRHVNHGNRSVPTIVFPDGTILVEPTGEELDTQFGH